MFLGWLRCAALMSCSDASPSGYQPFHHLNGVEIEVLRMTKQPMQEDICAGLKTAPGYYNEVSL